MEWLQSFSVDQLQWIYIATVIFLAIIVYFIGRRRRIEDSNVIAYMMDWFEVRGIGTIYQLIVILSLMGIAWVGWRIPVEFENAMSGQMMSMEAFPRAQGMVGRLAQVVGAFGLALVALRSIRYVVPIMLFIFGIFAIYLAYQYIGFEV